MNNGKESDKEQFKMMHLANFCLQLRKTTKTAGFLKCEYYTPVVTYRWQQVKYHTFSNCCITLLSL
jgi:hypothetical protein